MSEQELMREMLVGTGGKADYLVVGDFEGLAVGIKPVCQPHKDEKYGPMILIGVRIRVANHENTDSPLSVSTILSESIIPFQQKSPERASMLHVKGFPPPHPGVKVEDIINSLAKIGYAKEMVEHYETMFNLNHDRDDVLAFLTEGWTDTLTKMLAMMKDISHVVGKLMGTDPLDSLLNSIPPDAKVQ